MGRLEWIGCISSLKNIFRDFISLSKEVSKALRNTGYWPDINGEPSAIAMSPRSNNDPADPSGASAMAGASGTSDSGLNGASNDMDSPQPGPSGLQDKSRMGSNAPKDNPAIEQYKKVMRDFQIDTCDFSSQGPNTHAFSNAFSKAGMPSSSIIFRVAQELSSLSTSLPLDFSSAIFLRTDDDKPTLMKVLITG